MLSHLKPLHFQRIVAVFGIRSFIVDIILIGQSKNLIQRDLCNFFWKFLLDFMVNIP